jgi:hypothetical protein
LLEEKLRVIYGDDKFLDKQKIPVQDKVPSKISEIPFELSGQ